MRAALISQYDRRAAVALAVVGVVYFGAAKFGLSLAFTTHQVTAFWPPTGIAVAALLLLGWRIWPAILIGAFAVNALSNEPLLTALGISLGNVAGPLAGTYVLRRWMGFDPALRNIGDALGLVFVGAALAMTITATNGVVQLAQAGIIQWSAVPSVWWVWWLGDTMGVLLFAPLVLAWVSGSSVRFNPWKLAELAVLAAGVVLFSLVALTGMFGQSWAQLQIRYAIFPFIFWASLRFGHRESATIVALVAAIAVWGAIHDTGAFATGTLDQRLIALGLFMAATAVTALAFGVLLTERTAAQRGLEEAHAELEARVRKRTAELFESQFRFRAMVANVPGIVFQLRRNADGALRYTFISDGVKEVLGWTAREVLANPALIFDAYLPEEEDDRQRVFLDTDESMGIARSREFRIRRADGAVRWVQSRWVFRQSEGGEVTWDGFTIDITEQREREEELRSAKELLSVVTQHIPGILFRREVTPAGTPSYSFVAGSLLDTFRLNAGAVLRNPQLLFDILHPTDRAEQKQALNPSLEDLGSRRFVLRGITPAGEIRWLDVKTEARRHPDGRVYRDGLITDVTQLKEAEAALTASEARYRSLLNQVPAVVFQQRLGKDGIPVFTFFSDRLEATMGIKPGAALADPALVQSIFLPEDDSIRRKSLQESTRSLSMRDLEFRFKHADGTIHWLHLRAEPHREPGGDIVWDGIVHDVTDRKRLEENLRQSERLEAIAQLTDGVAHNFNNVLAIISGFAENIALDAPEDARAKESAQQIDRAVQRGAQLVKDLRDFSRRTPATADGLAVNDVLSRVAAMSQPALNTNTTLQVQSASASWRAAVDSSRLQTALLHLILNARDALSGGGEIHLAARNVELSGKDADVLGLNSGRYVQVSVKDNGIGMPQEVLERATNLFFSTKPVGQGTGLGLSMVYGFAKQSGGALKIDSIPGAGTEVTITLPAQEAS